MAKATSDTRPVVPRLVRLLSTPTGRVLRFGLVISLTFLVAALVVRHSRIVVARMPAYRIGPESVVFLDLPAHVDERMRGALADGLAAAWPAAVARRPCIFDPALDRRVRELLSAHPMIRDVADVELRFPSEVRVRAQLRTPLARVQARVVLRRGGVPTYVKLPVDGEGVVLDPDTYAGFLAEHRAVVVTGVDAAFPGVGRRWVDSKEQVAEGLAAARVANRLNAALVGLAAPKIDAVDVAGFPASPRTRMRGEVVFVLSDGRTVQWGRTERDLSGVTREDSFDAKRDRLMDALSTRSVDDRRVLDVRFPPQLRELGARADG